MKREVKIFGLAIVLLVSLLSFSIAAETTATTPSICCEKTVSGLFCQDVPSSQCASGSRQVPTACSSTSFCRTGFCYDSQKGTCNDNVPQLVCNTNNGTWSETQPPQCNLGCCVLGDQAAFVPLVRCKRLSAELGLQTNYNSAIKDEVSCVLSVQNQQKGACVFTSDFEKTCKASTRAECAGGLGGNFSGQKGAFYPGKLCTAEELGTVCAPTKNTACVPGKDGVYFVDSCGNPANVYDSAKLNDKEYWANIKDVSQSCGIGKDNAGSSSCGNCNYLLGSFCRDSKTAGATPTYGTNICANLNCKNTQNGQSYKHGESWCVFNDEGTTGEGQDSVGSRFYKHICINGQEVLEQCADFRQEECIQDTIQAAGTTFSQAACRVNRWQDCTAQISERDCLNTDRRDCYWQNGTRLSTTNDTSAEKGVCLPKDPPGLQFWEGEQAKNICAQGNAVCVVTFEKGIFGGEKATNNAECLTEEWRKQKTAICMSLGDCGPNVNWVGEQGYTPGYNVSIKNAPKK